MGRQSLIIRALYGGNSYVADYWLHVRSDMEEMGFKSCTADPDVWFFSATKANGTDY